MMDPSRRGKPLDLALFAQFRAAPPGPRKRRLLEQLMYENEPLCKLLTGQLCGFGEATRKRGFRAMGGCAGFRDLDIDDALQAGLLALQKSLEQFDPSKGKFAPYTKMKLRHELQRLVFSGGSIVRVPRGKGEAIPVALIGEAGDLDILSGGYDDADLAVASGQGHDEVTGQLEGAFTIAVDPDEIASANDIARWQQEQVDERPSITIVEPPRVFLSGIEAFLSNRVALKPGSRIETATAYNAYQIECRKAQFEETTRTLFVAWMAGSGIREVFVRAAHRASARALADIRLLGR